MFRSKQREITYTVEQLREFEKNIATEFESGKIRGPVHLSHGNEDYLIDLFQYIHSDDWVFSTWRNHYHALLHGVSQEYLREQISDSHSISFQSPDNHFFTSAIVGGIIPIAVGTALGIKWKNDARENELNPLQPDGISTTKGFIPDQRMVWCFVGDMAASSGTFFEAVKYSIFNKLPIHFIIENNTLSTNTPTAMSWGLKDAFNTMSIWAGLSWLNKDQLNEYVSYFQYERTIYPDQGTGTWINF